MLTLSCKDMGMNDDFTATGKTSAAVKKKMLEHAEKSHRDMLAKMTDEEKKQMGMKMDELLASQK